MDTRKFYRFLLLSAVFACSLVASPAFAQQLQSRPISLSAEIGGPGGAYTLGAEHLFVRTSATQLGLRGGISYTDNFIWEGMARTLSVGILGARRTGALGKQPLALEAGLGATAVFSTYDDSHPSGLASSGEIMPYVSGALRVESAKGRLVYRLGALLLSDDSSPFVLPTLGVQVGLGK